MQRISRALDSIWTVAGEGFVNTDEPFTDDQFSRIYNLYHEGHKAGTHHREVHDWLAESDPLDAVEELHRQKADSDLNQMVVSALSGKSDDPDYVRYAGPSWHRKGYEDGRGGRFDYDGFHPFKGGWRYDPPTPEDPMRRNGPW